MKSKWVIYCPINKTFWKEFRNYGYGFDNKPVLDVRFTDDLNQASQISKDRARQVLNKFNEYDFILGGNVKADPKTLIIKEVFFTIEL